MKGDKDVSSTFKEKNRGESGAPPWTTPSSSASLYQAGGRHHTTRVQE